MHPIEVDSGTVHSSIQTLERRCIQSRHGQTAPHQWFLAWVEIGSKVPSPAGLIVSDVSLPTQQPKRLHLFLAAQTSAVRNSNPSLQDHTACSHTPIRRARTHSLSPRPHLSSLPRCRRRRRKASSSEVAYVTLARFEVAEVSLKTGADGSTATALPGRASRP
jgi:hypothetical protein